VTLKIMILLTMGVCALARVYVYTHMLSFNDLTTL